MTNDELNLWIAEKIEPKPFSDWQPRDFCAEPDLTVMLMEQAGFVNLVRSDEDFEYSATFCGETVHNLDCGKKIKTATHANLRRAVAEAWALANGLEAK